MYRFLLLGLVSLVSIGFGSLCQPPNQTPPTCDCANLHESLENLTLRQQLLEARLDELTAPATPYTAADAVQDALMDKENTPVE